MWGVLLRDLSSHLSEFQKKPRKTPNDYVDKEQSRFEPGTSHLPARVGLGWVVDFEANCPLVGPGPIEVVPSVGVFPRDPSPYLSEFRRNPRKTPNGEVDKRDRGLNLAPPVYQF